eukprot:UN32618
MNCSLDSEKSSIVYETNQQYQRRNIPLLEYAVSDVMIPDWRNKKMLRNEKAKTRVEIRKQLVNIQLIFDNVIAMYGKDDNGGGLVLPDLSNVDLAQVSPLANLQNPQGHQKRSWGSEMVNNVGISYFPVSWEQVCSGYIKVINNATKSCLGD